MDVFLLKNKQKTLKKNDIKTIYKNLSIIRICDNIGHILGKANIISYPMLVKTYKFTYLYWRNLIEER